MNKQSNTKTNAIKYYLLLALVSFFVASMAYYVGFETFAEKPKPSKNATAKEIADLVLKTSPYCRDEFRVLLQHHLLNEGLITQNELLTSQKAACGALGEQMKATRA